MALDIYSNRPSRHAAMVDVDLRPLGGTITQLQGQLQLDGVSRPDGVLIHAHHLPSAVLTELARLDPSGKMRGVVLHGRFAGGGVLTTTIQFLWKFQFTGASAADVTFLVSDLSITRSLSPSPPIASCEFRICNFCPFIYDEPSPTPRPRGWDPRTSFRGFQLDKIPFRAGGRDWLLKQRLAKQVNAEALKEMPHPVLTASLSTPTDGSNLPDISQAADVLCDILSVALGRAVAWTTRSILTGKRQAMETLLRKTSTVAFNRRASVVVDNWSQGLLRGFVETAYNSVMSAPEWFVMTLKMFNLAQLAEYLDVKCTLLNVLIERVSCYVLSGDGGVEIDAKLPNALRDAGFVAKLDAVFRSASDKWTRERTKTIIETVLRWNESPSFPKQIQRACAKLGLQKPDGKLLSARHRLLHTGRLEADGTSIVEYWKELHWHVLVMILRLLKYDGDFYHLKLGDAHKPLKSFLVGEPSP